MIELRVNAESAAEFNTELISLLEALVGNKTSITVASPQAADPTQMALPFDDKEETPFDVSAPAPKEKKKRAPRKSKTDPPKEAPTLGLELTPATEEEEDAEQAQIHFTATQVTEALQKVNVSKGLPAAREVLAKFNCARMSELDAEDRGAFIDACNKTAGA